ncbi:Alpha amylase inhibitor [Amycolatopsis arida]|uniref:Alpha amylase inhibitor n=1 Tax=Amycolatopsis arida TaxID=587909 RepID=A0A1I6AQG6_9PSEU|nr:alpha amylase inhibitor [Amycolatopsis arida]SFQ70920.1 Alpha amylase inhibitor [Amycolatopsis arida]
MVPMAMATPATAAEALPQTLPTENTNLFRAAPPPPCVTVREDNPAGVTTRFTATNHCHFQVRVKFTYRFAMDSRCYTINPGQSASHTRTRGTGQIFDGLKAC